MANYLRGFHSWLEIQIGNVTRSVQHSHQIDAIRHRQVVRNVPADGKTAEVVGQFIPCATHRRLSGKTIEFVLDQLEKPGRIGWTIVGDGFPDLDQVRQCPWSFGDDRHGLRLLAIATARGAAALSLGDDFPHVQR